MADGTVKDRFEDVEPLAKLKAPDGVYAITGNHEYYFNAGEWVTAYTHLGLRFLNNSHVRIYRGQASFVLAGVTDDIAAQHGGIAPSLRQALRRTAATDTVILLDHKPINARLSAVEGVALQLSGHTHGGMIRGLDLAAALANNGFISGQYQVGNMILYVSNGAGLWNGFPLRLGRPSEITHIRLHTKAG
ncbi:metallophosphoesterase [Yersinia mollaretii]|uniref:metallophosphoesterase n=1 Tax=Yersinia mollaretii TaxID=33060 RepID=UPI0019553013|nr:metallophosphoesterase [Yersinia mollaretii]